MEKKIVPTRIELIKPHTHAGRNYPPGAIITVDSDAAEWLIGNGVAKAAAPESATRR